MTQIVGRVNKSGDVEAGNRFFESSRLREGVYEVTFRGSPFNREPTIVATSVVDEENEASGVGLHGASALGFQIHIKTMDGSLIDRGFNFTVKDSVGVACAVYSELSPETKPLEAGANTRVFNTVDFQNGGGIDLDQGTGVVTLQAGTYHITASSIVTYFEDKDALDGKVTTLKRPNGGYCFLQNQADDSILATGTISHANMLPSLIDTYLLVDTSLEMALVHQAGTDVEGLYLQVYVENSDNHVFARMNIRRL